MRFWMQKRFVVLTNVRRYERTEGRKDLRAGSYHRKLLTKAGEVDFKVPRLRILPFVSAIIDGTSAEKSVSKWPW